MINSDATKVVLKRLSSLRAVLESDEQRVLDGMITGAYSVEAHVLSPDAHADEVLRGEDEVLAHVLSPDAHADEVLRGEDEVLAHVLSFKVAFDGDRDAYVIVT